MMLHDGCAIALGAHSCSIYDLFPYVYFVILCSKDQGSPVMWWMVLQVWPSWTTSRPFRSIAAGDDHDTLELPNRETMAASLLRNRMQLLESSKSDLVFFAEIKVPGLRDQYILRGLRTISCLVQILITYYTCLAFFWHGHMPQDAATNRPNPHLSDGSPRAAIWTPWMMHATDCNRGT